MTAEDTSHTTHSVRASASAFVRDLVLSNPRRCAIAVVAVLAGGFLEGLGLAMLAPLLGTVFATKGGPHWMQQGLESVFDEVGIRSTFARLLVLLLCLCALVLARALVLLARDVTLAKVQFAFVERQRLRIVEHLARLDWEHIAALRHARVTQVMSGDTQRLGIAVNFAMVGFSAFAILAAQVALAFLLAPLGAAVIAGLLLLGLVALAPMVRGAKSIGGYIADVNLSLLDNMAQFLGGLKLAISHDLGVSFVGETAVTLDRLVDRQVQYVTRQAGMQAMGSVLFLLVGSALVLAGYGLLGIAPAVLMALLVIVVRMTAPTQKVAEGVQQFAYLLGLFDKICDLDRDLAKGGAHSASRPSCEPFVPPKGDIVFSRVSYRHVGPADENGAEVGGGLGGFDLTIRRGEFVGITGPSGVGKTTFADLLARLYLPQTGTISIGGVDLASIDVTRWRERLSYVSQDAFLFHDTIRRNLSWTGAGATADEMWRALAFAGADSLVRSMPHGLDTLVGERGTLVSGGERQRIALARAILRDADLIVLDEATSAIDTISEGEIFARLKRLAATIVVIAHRTENLVTCDRVVHLDAKGRATIASAEHARSVGASPPTSTRATIA